MHTLDFYKINPFLIDVPINCTYYIVIIPKVKALLLKVCSEQRVECLHCTVIAERLSVRQLILLRISFSGCMYVCMYIRHA